MEYAAWVEEKKLTAKVEPKVGRCRLILSKPR